MSAGFRVDLLCEDRLSERLLRGLCSRYGLRLLDIHVAPHGRGAASDWVLDHYAELVQRRRSKNFQTRRGLLVHIDGDAGGVAARKTELDQRLVGAAHPPRSADEPVALIVPTWCVETWLLHLGGLAQPPETAKLKRDPDPTYRPALEQLRTREMEIIRRAVDGWHLLSPAPSSLIDARAEGTRVGLTGSRSGG